LVAWTLIVVDATIDYHGWQQITIVDPAHRGHRLGISSKLENLAYARGAGVAAGQGTGRAVGGEPSRSIFGLMAIESTIHNPWPALPVAEWQDTRDRLQLYT
jgi:hypothetical protein